MTKLTHTDDTQPVLIPVFTEKIGGIETHVVNACDLHGFLGVKRDFSTWISRRIDDCDFSENGPSGS